MLVFMPVGHCGVFFVLFAVSVSYSTLHKLIQQDFEMTGLIMHLQ